MQCSRNIFFSPELLRYSLTRRIRFHSARYFLNNHFGSSNLGKPVKIQKFRFLRIFGQILGHLKKSSGFGNMVSRFSTKVSQLDAMEHYSVLCLRFEQKYLIKRAVKMEGLRLLICGWSHKIRYCSLPFLPVPGYWLKYLLK